MKESLKQNGDTFTHEIEDGDQKFAVQLSGADIERIMLAAIKASKEPDEETQQRLAQEKAQRDQSMKNMLAEARQSEEATRNRQTRCSHRKPDQATAVHGQIHSDGKIHPICVICQKLFVPYEAPREMMTGTGF